MTRERAVVGLTLLVVLFDVSTYPQTGDDEDHTPELHAHKDLTFI